MAEMTALNHGQIELQGTVRRRTAGEASMLTRSKQRIEAMGQRWVQILMVTAILAGRVYAGDAAPSPFTTPLDASDFDRSAFAEWVDGKEALIAGVDEAPRPSWVVWTRGTAPGHSGFTHGVSAVAGTRHLRVGFNRPIPVGSVLALGSDRISVLRPDAVYPGDMADESQWVQAQRIKNGRVISEQAERGDYTVWVLPSVLTTRAVRFTHEAKNDDASYAGWLGGAYVLAERMANIAPLGSITASAENRFAERLNNESNDGIWQAWENISARDGVRSKTIAQNPEWVTLIWPQPMALRGLGLLLAGFSDADVQIYVGPVERHPRQADEADWKTVKHVRGLKNQYPRALGVDWIDFGGTVKTRAVRLRMTAVTDEGHPHMKGHTAGGKRVWLAELMALHPLGSANAVSAVPALAEVPQHAPIPIRFKLPTSGEVTLVVEDEAGHRVRNLVAATPFPGGENTVYWDGMDDSGRDLDAAAHGVYHIPGHLVEPGRYRVRGLWHKPANLRYEFSVNSNGDPPWSTTDGTGGWTTNHTPPTSVLFVPADSAPGGKPLIFIGSYISEGGSALAWVNLDGKKQGGRGWIGGNWTGAQFLARDNGADADSSVYAYVGAAWKSDPTKDDAEIRLTALTKTGDRDVRHHAFRQVKGNDPISSTLGGIAVHNGLLVFSQTSLDQLVAISAKSGEVVGTVAVTSPRGLAFDREGRLLVLTNNALLHYRITGDSAVIFGPPEKLMADLDDPVGITLNDDGDIYIAERGSRHQVRQFSLTGQFLRTFGRPGVPQAGLYDPSHMNNPRGLAVDANGRLWVAEEDFQPKRVSVWNLDGSLWKAFYGPPAYGGGGSLDPQDKTRFVYNGMEFRLDWATGQSRPERIIYRPALEAQPLAKDMAPPQTPFYVNGRRYLTNAFSQNPTNGSSTAFIFLDKGDAATPVAGMGRAADWKLLQDPIFKPRWPAGQDVSGGPSKEAVFIWNDLNGNGRVDPEEVTLRSGESGGVTVQHDASFVVARVNFADTKGAAMRFSPTRFTADGVPVYDWNEGKVLAEAVNRPLSTGGDQALTDSNGWTVLSTAPKPFSAAGLAGIKDGVGQWSYPSLWPGLHASHSAPLPEAPGELVGTTRLLGDFVTPRNSEAGSLFLINGNFGSIYVFTEDGLFVTTLFQDRRLGNLWSMPAARRGMLLNGVSPGDEHFFPTVNQTADGEIYLVAGHLFSAIVHVEGLETARRIGPWPLQVSANDLKQAEAFAFQREAERQATQGTDTLIVSFRSAEPKIDDELADWKEANWVDIDRRGVAAYFDSNSKPYAEMGALMVAKGKLFAAWKTGDANLLMNSGAQGNALFKSGGALDLMLGATPEVNPGRTQAVEGDERLLVTRVNGQPKALLYRAVVPGTKADEKVQFNSPWRSVSFDRVDDVSDDVALTADGRGNYEVSIPLGLLGLRPQAGMKIRGDIGVLRGSGNETVQRAYWSNKATAILADLPSEAILAPQLWGRFVFGPSPDVASIKTPENR